MQRTFEGLRIVGESSDGTTQEADVGELFRVGEFEYGPSLVHGLEYEDLKSRFVIKAAFDSETELPELSFAAVELLTQRNLRNLRMRRGQTWPQPLELFVPVGIKPGFSLTVAQNEELSSVPIPQALVIPHVQIQGRINGANREMLDRVYEDLGVKKDPEVELSEHGQTYFGGPDYLTNPGTPAQKHTHHKFHPSLRGGWRISDRFRRPVIDEIEIRFDNGDVNSVVQVAR